MTARVIGFMSMEEAYDWEKITEGVDRAIQAGFTKEEIASSIGTDGANLSNILKRRAPRSKYVPALRAWLSRHIWNTDGLEEEEIPTALMKFYLSLWKNSLQQYTYLARTVKAANSDMEEQNIDSAREQLRFAITLIEGSQTLLTSIGELTKAMHETLNEKGTLPSAILDTADEFSRIFDESMSNRKNIAEDNTKLPPALSDTAKREVGLATDQPRRRRKNNQEPDY